MYLYTYVIQGKKSNNINICTVSIYLCTYIIHVFFELFLYIFYFDLSCLLP